MHAAVASIAYHLPERVLSNRQLAEEFPDWSAEKIEQKTGIAERHVAGADECASDLACAAANRLFDSGVCRREDIDFLLLCTQSPDFFLPTTACLLQDRLGLNQTVGALDFNLGCSGYGYGLGLAKGLIETGQARRVLLLTAETYTKFIHPQDRSVRTLFGDAASATLVHGVPAAPAPGRDWLGPFVYGTDGRGAKNLIVPAGGLRQPQTQETAQEYTDEHGNCRSRNHLFMSGADIFHFTLQSLPPAIQQVLSRAGCTLDDIDLFVFHQANRYMLEHLRDKLDIPKNKFVISMRNCGNTVSSTIPIALRDSIDAERLRPGMRLMLVGFGVGYSWVANLMTWRGWPGEA